MRNDLTTRLNRSACTLDNRVPLPLFLLQNIAAGSCLPDRGIHELYLTGCFQKQNAAVDWTFCCISQRISAFSLTFLGKPL